MRSDGYESDGITQKQIIFDDRKSHIRQVRPHEKRQHQLKVDGTTLEQMRQKDIV